jgi:hypothetical protein
MNAKRVISRVVLLGFLSWLGTGQAQMYEIVMDNTDPENTTYGTWGQHTLEDGHANNTFHYAAPSSGPSYSAYFRFVPPGALAAGHYALYARWASHPWLAPNTRYEIWYDFGANDSVRVNQAIDSGRWVKLGEWDVVEAVVVVRVYNDADGHVEADGLRWVKLGETVTQEYSSAVDHEQVGPTDGIQ